MPALLTRLTAVLATVMSSAAIAQENPESFYSQRQMRLVVGFAPGGIFDITARSVARYFVRHVPGQPRMIVQHMPGAGSVTAAEWMVAQAPRDGSTIVSISSSAIMQSVLGGKSAASSLSWLGSVESTTRVCVAFAASGVSSLDDALARGLVLGATGSGSTISDYAALARNVLGGALQVVPGYAGTAALALAMERREIDAICGVSLETVKTERPDWLARGMLNFLVAFSRPGAPGLPPVPSFLDRVSAADRDAVDLLVAQEEIARPYAAPPGVPSDRMDVLRRAFEATMRSPEFTSEMARSGAAISPMFAAEMTGIVERLNASSAQTRERARELTALR